MNDIVCKLMRVLGAAGIFGALVCAYTPLPNIFAQKLAAPSRIAPADAIVVLGAGVFKDGTLGEASLRRSVQGIVLYHRGLAPLIVFTGPSYEGSPVEAEVRAVLARQLKIPPKHILIETDAQTTAEEVAHIADELQRRGVKRVLLVSNALHLVRAAPRFEKHGLQVLSAPADDIPLSTDGPDGRWELMYFALREALARWMYQLGD